LAVVGTDFSMMAELFKNTRTRKELKLKYRIEQRRNPALVEQALTGKGSCFDLASLPEFGRETCFY
jgi:hypothetical protein